MNRLVAMETQLSHARQSLKQRDFHIAVLEEKVRLYMKAEEDAVGSKMGFLETLKDTRMSSVEEKCRKLERQVMEMERFLGEYGMVWCEAEETYLLDNPVNASCSYSSSEATTPNITPSHTPRAHPRVRIKRHRRNHKNREVRRVVAESTSRSISSEAEPFSLDYEKLLAAITELNIVAQGDAAAEFEQSSKVGRQACESLQLTLYKNGVVVDDGGFRSFESVKTRQFLQDILDGFFPSELQDIYPQGVPIK
ncbi:UBX domain-containing protein 11-like, partial [Homarus americanus]